MTATLATDIDLTALRAGDTITFRALYAPEGEFITAPVMRNARGAVTTTLGQRLIYGHGRIDTFGTDQLEIVEIGGPRELQAETGIYWLGSLLAQGRLRQGAKITYRLRDAPVGTAVTATIHRCADDLLRTTAGNIVRYAGVEGGVPTFWTDYVVVDFEDGPDLELAFELQTGDVLVDDEGRPVWVRTGDDVWASLLRYRTSTDDEARFLVKCAGHTFGHISMTRRGDDVAPVL